MIITKEHPEDQARKTRTKHYGYDIPLPSHHPDKRDGANNDGEPIDHAITGKNHVQGVKVVQVVTKAPSVAAAIGGNGPG